MNSSTLSLPLLCLLGPLSAQDPEPIDDDALLARVEAAAAELHAAGSLRSDAALRERLVQATTVELAPAPASTTPLSPPDLYDRVRASTLLVAIWYRCPDCPNWHVTASTGFAIGADGLVATCAHVLAEEAGQPSAFVAIADLQGRVWPVTDVVAADVAQDLCVLRCAAKFTPLPLRAGARVGERVWCLSHPDHQFGWFSEGMVARWQQLRGAPGGTSDEGEPAHGVRPPAGPITRWLQVTTPFARGSSGGPIVDSCGNVVGIAQSTTTIVHDEEADLVDTQMIAWNAAPASVLAALCRAPAAAPAKAR
ncbi:MAG: trypsin-like peptidase domain-containing protein [Planctomycetes bacterium]|nr:trypsin-like peptidase domain-containing protein [Planctomycetota bacterium]